MHEETSAWIKLKDLSGNTQGLASIRAGLPFLGILDINPLLPENDYNVYLESPMNIPPVVVASFRTKPLSARFNQMKKDELQNFIKENNISIDVNQNKDELVEELTNLFPEEANEETNVNA